MRTSSPIIGRPVTEFPTVCVPYYEKHLRHRQTGHQSRRVHLGLHSEPTYCRPTERSAACPFGPACPGDIAQGAPATIVSKVQRCLFTATCLEAGKTTC